MKKNLSVVLIFSVCFLFTVNIFSEEYKSDFIFTEETPLVLFDFDNRSAINNVNGQSGVFDSDGEDPDSFCKIGYSKDTELHKKGFNGKISYDVDSTKPAYNGWWTKLENINLSKFEALSITIKGDKENGFSEIFKIELKSKNKKMDYVLEGITDEWGKIIIPFKDFEGDIEYSQMNEFVIVFEDWRIEAKTGVYYIDDISFVPKGKTKVKYSQVIQK